MNPIQRLIVLIGLLLSPAASGWLSAAQSYADYSAIAKDTDLARVMAADDERIAALLARDRARLEMVLSPELRYAHSSGVVEDRVAFLAAMDEGRTVYQSYDYRRRTFHPIAPGVVLMSGRVDIQATSASGPVALDLNFLAVWREENGRWRFLAWQSSRVPPPQTATTPGSGTEASSAAP